MPDDNLTHGHRHRVRVFVDFWNFSLSMRDVEAEFRPDWSKLGPVLSREAAKVTSAPTGEYQGLNFYGSHDPTSETGQKTASVGHYGCRYFSRRKRIHCTTAEKTLTAQLPSVSQAGSQVHCLRR